VHDSTPVVYLLECVALPKDRVGCLTNVSLGEGSNCCALALTAIS